MGISYGWALIFKTNRMSFSYDPYGFGEQSFIQCLLHTVIVFHRVDNFYAVWYFLLIIYSVSIGETSSYCETWDLYAQGRLISDDMFKHFTIQPVTFSILGHSSRSLYHWKATENRYHFMYFLS